MDVLIRLNKRFDAGFDALDLLGEERDLLFP